MGSTMCYIYVLFCIIWKSGVRLSIVSDPCPDIQPSTQVTDMCQTGLAVEQIGESKDGNLNFDHVILRARTQVDSCTCLVFIENQSSQISIMYIQPYRQLPSSAPKELECGMELYLDFYYMETLQEGQMLPIRCTSGQISHSLSINKNSVLRFTSKVSNGNFTRGYCIDIQRVHVPGQNGTLKIACDIPGIIPSLQYTTPQSLDLSTKSSDHSTSMTNFGDSTVYIASGVSVGVVVIAATAIAIIFCKRHQSRSKEPVPIDNVNMQYDSLSETRKDSNYSTLNNAQADDQQHQSRSKEPVPIDNVNMQYESLSETRNDSNYSTLNSAQADEQQYELVET